MTLVAEPSALPRWDLSDLYNSSDDPRIENDLQNAQSRAEAFQLEYKGKINPLQLSPAQMLAAVREYEAIQQEAGKPGAYASLIFSVNTGDAVRGALLQRTREAGAALSVSLLFFELELAAMPEPDADTLLLDPRFAPYRHYLTQVRLAHDYLLSEPEERILEELSTTGASAFDRLFDEVTSNATFELDGKNLTQPELLSLLYAPDRTVRASAAASFSRGLQETSRVTSFAFNSILQEKSVKDRLRGYQYPEQSRHLSNELSQSVVTRVTDAVVAHYPVVERYYLLKKEILGLPELTHYDRYAPLFQADETLSFEQAKGVTLDAFNDFSPELRKRAEEFFAGNWIDAQPAQGKQGGAYCSYITPDLHPYIFMNYLGRMKDVMTLAHELGHGAHASLSRGQTLLNFHGTLPLAELSSTFAEQLVFQKTVQEASLRNRLVLYAEKLESAFATIFRQTAMYRFEQSIHRHRRERGELSLNDFGSYWQDELQRMFGSSVALGEEHRLWWSYIGHFTGSPFYVYAYSFGELLALALFRQWQREGPPFAQRFLGMLEAGGSQTPAELASMVGADLEDASFWEGGFAVVSALVDQFENLWREYQASQSA